jgi:hypothetical protein
MTTRRWLRKHLISMNPSPAPELLLKRFVGRLKHPTVFNQWSTNLDNIMPCRHEGQTLDLLVLLYIRKTRPPLPHILEPSKPPDRKRRGFRGGGEMNLNCGVEEELIA